MMDTLSQEDQDKLRAEVAWLFGGLLFAHLPSLIVFGVTLFQSVLYFSVWGRRDRGFLKIMVIVVLALEVFHVFVGIYFAFFFIIGTTAYPVSVDMIDVHNTWSQDFYFLFAAPHVCIIQLYFAYRVYIYSEKKILVSSAIAFLGFAQLVVSFGLPTAVHMDFYEHLSVTVVPNLMLGYYAVDIAGNILTVVSMTLNFRKRDPMFDHTEKMLWKILVFSLRTCLLVTICDIIAAVMTNTYVAGEYYYVPAMLTSRLYTCSLLSVLNGRRSLRKIMKSPNFDELDTVDTASPVIELGILHPIQSTG